MIVAGNLIGARLIEESSEDFHLRQRHLLVYKTRLMAMFHIREYRASGAREPRNGDDLCEIQIHRFNIVSVTKYSIQMGRSALCSGSEA